MANPWVDVKIDGLKELERNLEALPKKVAQKVLREALRDGAQLVREEFITSAPTPQNQTPNGGRRKKADGMGKTTLGHLKEKGSWRIRYKGRAEDYAGSAYVGPSNKVLETRTSGKTKGLPRTAARIVSWLELGTKTRTRYPFMTSAWESVKEKVLDRIIEALKDALE